MPSGPRGPRDNTQTWGSESTDSCVTAARHLNILGVLKSTSDGPSPSTKRIGQRRGDELPCPLDSLWGSDMTYGRSAANRAKRPVGRPSLRSE